MTNLLERVELSIRERKLLRRGEKILVAVSGGLDSMVLMRLLHALATRHRWQLIVAHFNHQLRGRASAADEQLVARAANALGLQVEAGRDAVQEYARRQKLSLEMAARALRHEFLAKTARRFNCRSIALAHHADDQVELFFLRLLRGAGGEGLAGMKWRAPSPADSHIQLIRPLLNISRAELEKFAHKNKIRFREDATNASREIPRNRIRQELLPLIRRHYQPALDRTLLRAMEIIGAENELLENLARAWLTKEPVVFARLAVALQRRALRWQLRRLKLAEDFDLVESLRLSPSRPVTIRPGVAVERDAAGRVRVRITARESFASNRVALELRSPTGEATLDGLRVRWKLTTQTGARFRREPGCEHFDAVKVGRRIVLRHWQPGDRFQPSGLTSTVKLQNWFTNQKVPSAERRRLVVACTAEGEVFWIENQRIAEPFKLSQQTKRRLIWKWWRD